MNDQGKFASHTVCVFRKPSGQLLGFKGVHGFKLLGQFTPDRHKPAAQHVESLSQGFNAMRCLEQHHRTWLTAQRFDGALSFSCLGRQEAREHKASFSHNASGTQQCGHTAGARQRHDPIARCCNGRYQACARIADGGCAGITHISNALTLCQSGDDLGRRFGFVVLVNGQQLSAVSV